MLLTAALNGSATAAVGLLAPVDGTRVVLPGAGGLVIDPNTHIPGLVARTTPRRDLSVRPDPDAARTVGALEADLREAHDARAAANVVVATILGLLALLAIATRSPFVARTAVLYAPAAIGVGLAWRSSLAIGFGALALSVAAAPYARAFRPLLAAVFASALFVLWHWPVTNALATIGPHPDGGHRFFGVTNQVETMLLAPALVAGSRPHRSRSWRSAGARRAPTAAGSSSTRRAMRGRCCSGSGASRCAARCSPARSSRRSAPWSSRSTPRPGLEPRDPCARRGPARDLAHRLDVSYHGATRSIGRSSCSPSAWR